MKQPWFKFYPTDWIADPALRQCSMAARGLWIHMLCIMHQAPIRGELAWHSPGFQPFQTVERLAKEASINPRTVRILLAELETNGVFERNELGVIYSRRMKREDQRSQIYRKNGSAGGNPVLLNQTDKQMSVELDNQNSSKLDKQLLKPEDNTQKLEARIQSQKEEKKENAREARLLRPDWPQDYKQQFWDRYPNPVGRGAAFKSLDRISHSKTGPPFVELMDGLNRYIAKTDDRPWCNPATWLNQHRWLDKPAAINGKANGHVQKPGLVAAADELLDEIRSRRHAAGSTDHVSQASLFAIQDRRRG